MSDFVDDQTQGGESALLGSFSSTTRTVTARGTQEGLVLRIDGRADWDEVLHDIEFFLGERRKFFEGAEVAIEWLDQLPTKGQSQELENNLRDNYGIKIIAPKRRPQEVIARKFPAESPAENPPENQERLEKNITVSLFDKPGEQMAAKWGAIGQAEREVVRKALDADASSGPPLPEALLSEDIGRKYVNHMSTILGDELLYEEEANGKVVYGTLRSGQRVETPFSLVVIGDVNPGADLIAGGDIVVLGSLRGTAHAGAYEEEAQSRTIIALHMQPMQLRIGSVISRGNGDLVRGMEIAHIEERKIVVEEFNTKVLTRKKLR